jgi:hypothetical protein
MGFRTEAFFLWKNRFIFEDFIFVLIQRESFWQNLRRFPFKLAIMYTRYWSRKEPLAVITNNRIIFGIFCVQKKSFVSIIYLISVASFLTNRSDRKCEDIFSVQKHLADNLIRQAELFADLRYVFSLEDMFT